MLLFISDLHLHTQRPAVTQAFFYFLQTTAKQAEALYILGDLFEVWLGDDDDTPVYREVINALSDCVNQGTPVYFMRGNRDFLVGEAFAQQTNCEILADPSIIQYEGLTYLLSHGDSLCTLDKDYMAFRSMTRSDSWQSDFLAHTLDQRRLYATEVRKSSKTMNSLKAEDIMDVSQDAVEALMLEYGIQTLIHGHTHRPKVHNLSINDSNARRFVLGDWGSQGWYITIDGQEVSLNNFGIN